MVAMHTAPSFDPPIANDRLKASFGRTLWLSMVVATVVHFLTFALWPELTAPRITLDRTALTTLELPPEIVIPEAPAPLARPALPVVATADVADDLTIPLTTFRDNPVETLGPPPADRTGGDAIDGPRFTPFTLAPTLLNGTEVVRVMEREYPPLLRDAGIGGTVRVFFFIGEEGQVLETRLDRTSGHPALDEAAMKVAGVYSFRPAQNRDTRVSVWVSIPITFRVR